MAGDVVFCGSEPVEKMVSRLVREARWVGEPPREASDPIAQAVLQGRW
jgi:hypothetical protein